MTRAILNAFLAVVLSSFLAACPADIPPWTGKVYKGDAAETAIKRLNDTGDGHEVIYCNDPAFNGYYCVHEEPFKVLIVNYNEAAKCCNECLKIARKR